MKRSFLAVGLAALTLGVIACSAVAARSRHQENTLTDVSNFFITARLVDEKKNAAKRSATVEVTVQGIRLMAPALPSGAPGRIQGYLNYQLDGGPIIATPIPKLSFYELSPGGHKIVVNLADDNHIPIGMPVMLRVTVPAIKTVMAY